MSKIAEELMASESVEDAIRRYMAEGQGGVMYAVEALPEKRSLLGSRRTPVLHHPDTPSPQPDANFETGAVRSADANNLRFDLIHPIAKIALARVYAEGAEKYGDCNWERGMPIHDLYNHVDRHYTLYFAGDRSEPHLEHAAWGALAIVVSSVLWPELNEAHLRGPGCTLTPAMLAHQEAGDPERARKRKAGLFEGLASWSLSKVKEVANILGARS